MGWLGKESQNGSPCPSGYGEPPLLWGPDILTLLAFLGGLPPKFLQLCSSQAVTMGSNLPTVPTFAVQTCTHLSFQDQLENCCVIGVLPAGKISLFHSPSGWGCGAVASGCGWCQCFVQSLQTRLAFLLPK